MIFLVLIAIGSIIGVLSTFFGMGGGILIIPMLYSIFPFLPPQTVIGTSLTFIFLNSFKNLYHFKKAGISPEYRYLLPIIISMFIAVFIGGRITLLIDDKILKLLFSIYILFIAIKTLATRPSKRQTVEWRPEASFKATLLGVFTGTVSGLVIGLGGGAILIPLLISVQKIPLRQLAVNTNACALAGALGGTLSYLLHPTPTFIFNYPALEAGQAGFINFTLVITLLIGATMSSKFGVNWTQRVNPKVTRILFVVMLMTISIKTFISSQFY